MDGDYQVTWNFLILGLNEPSFSVISRSGAFIFSTTCLTIKYMVDDGPMVEAMRMCDDYDQQEFRFNITQGTSLQLVLEFDVGFWDDLYVQEVFVSGTKQRQVSPGRVIGSITGQRAQVVADVTPNGCWSQFALTYTIATSALVLYKDGIEAESLTTGGWVAAETDGLLQAGCSPGGESCFHGAIDEVRLYDHPLTHGQVVESLGTDLNQCPSCGDGYFFVGFETPQTCPEDAIRLNAIIPSVALASGFGSFNLLFESTFGSKFGPTNDTFVALSSTGNCSDLDRIAQSSVTRAGVARFHLDELDIGTYAFCFKTGNQDWQPQRTTLEILNDAIDVVPNSFKQGNTTMIELQYAQGNQSQSGTLRLVRAGLTDCETYVAEVTMIANAFAMPPVPRGTYTICVASSFGWVMYHSDVSLSILPDAAALPPVPAADVSFLFNDVTVDAAKAIVESMDLTPNSLFLELGNATVTQGVDQEGAFFIEGQGFSVIDTASASITAAAQQDNGITISTWAKPIASRVQGATRGANMDLLRLAGVTLSFMQEDNEVAAAESLIFVDNFDDRRDGVYTHQPYSDLFKIDDNNRLSGADAEFKASWVFDVRGYSKLRLEADASHGGSFLFTTDCVRVKATLDDGPPFQSAACDDFIAQRIKIEGLGEGNVLKVEVAFVSTVPADTMQLDELRIYGNKTQVNSPAGVKSSVQWGFESSSIASTYETAPTAPRPCWQHVATVIDTSAGTHTLYLDGRQVASTSFNAAPALGQLKDEISCGADLDDCFAGALDSIQVYTQPLTPDEIASLANSNAPDECDSCGDGICSIGFESVANCAVDCLQVASAAPTFFQAGLSFDLSLSLPTAVLAPILTFAEGQWKAKLVSEDQNCGAVSSEYDIDNNGVVPSVGKPAGSYVICIKRAGSEWIRQSAVDQLIGVVSIQSIDIQASGDILEVNFLNATLEPSSPIRIIPLIGGASSDCADAEASSTTDERGVGFMLNISQLVAGAYQICNYVPSLDVWIKQPSADAIIRLRETPMSLPRAKSLLWDMENLAQASQSEIAQGSFSDWNIKSTDGGAHGLEVTQGAVGSSAALFDGQEYLEQNGNSSTNLVADISQSDGDGLTLSTWIRPLDNLFDAVEGKDMFIARAAGLSLEFKEGRVLRGTKAVVFVDNFATRRDGLFETSIPFEDGFEIDGEKFFYEGIYPDGRDEELSWSFTINGLEDLQVELDADSVVPNNFEFDDCLTLYASVNGGQPIELDQKCNGLPEDSTLTGSLSDRSGNIMKVWIDTNLNSAFEAYSIHEVRVSATPVRVVSPFSVTSNAFIGSVSSSITSNERAFRGIRPGSWQHVATVIDAQSKTHLLYVDGYLAQRSTFEGDLDVTQLTSNSARAYAGCAPPGADCFEGTIDDIRVYSSPLTASQIHGLFVDTEPATLTPFCGDGVCQLGYETETSCAADCKLAALCGNGVVDQIEECDGGASCLFTCQCAPGTRPVGRSGRCQGFCGDGVASAAEDCDGGQGCSDTCTCDGVDYKPLLPREANCGLISKVDCNETQWEVQAPTWSSERLCAPITICDSDEWESRSPTAFRDRICRPITVCDNATEFLTQASTVTSDAVCADLTICKTSEFVVVPKTLSSDRECAGLTQCRDDQFESIPKTLTSDRMCNNITVCTSTQFEVAAPTPTSDRMCQAYSDCGEIGIATESTATSDRICNVAKSASSSASVSTGTLYGSVAGGVILVAVIAAVIIVVMRRQQTKKDRLDAGVITSSSNPMFARDGAINPVYDADQIETQSGLYSSVPGVQDYDEPGFEEADGHNVPEYENPSLTTDAGEQHVYSNQDDMFNDEDLGEDEEDDAFVSILIILPCAVVISHMMTYRAATWKLRATRISNTAFDLSFL
eukprot:TRINITY_DN12514_c1_g1_i3.p1 TRINITY_DN12514_c1_g1~~TRINITY_DN12514_c1_g1_i3.p1  ORF type:complete len:2125 (+),score=282.98 TRINITY_DN12514_c1_g1_i3:725-6376(+)